MKLQEIHEVLPYTTKYILAHLEKLYNFYLSLSVKEPLIVHIYF